jgi:hypothetical protein
LLFPKTKTYPNLFFLKTPTPTVLDSENFVRTETMRYLKYQITKEHWKVPSAQKSLSSFL